MNTVKGWFASKEIKELNLLGTEIIKELETASMNYYVTNEKQYDEHVNEIIENKRVRDVSNYELALEHMTPFSYVNSIITTLHKNLNNHETELDKIEVKVLFEEKITDEALNNKIEKYKTLQKTIKTILNDNNNNINPKEQGYGRGDYNSHRDSGAYPQINEGGGGFIPTLERVRIKGKRQKRIVYKKTNGTTRYVKEGGAFVKLNRNYEKC